MNVLRMVVIIWTMTFIMAALSGFAEVPQVINYQGRLTDLAGEPIVGHRNMIFTLYDDATGGTTLWSDTLLDVPLDSNGLFSVVFGDESAIPGETFDSPDVWLGIRLTVDPDEISPRTKLASVAYSFQSLKADSSGFAASIADNSVTSAKIQDGSIEFQDIGQNGAGTGQVMKWDGNTWVAQDDSGSDDSASSGIAFASGETLNINSLPDDTIFGEWFSVTIDCPKNGYVSLDFTANVKVGGCIMEIAIDSISGGQSIVTHKLGIGSCICSSLWSSASFSHVVAVQAGIHTYFVNVKQNSVACGSECHMGRLSATFFTINYGL